MHNITFEFLEPVGSTVKDLMASMATTGVMIMETGFAYQVTVKSLTILDTSLKALPVLQFIDIVSQADEHYEH